MLIDFLFQLIYVGNKDSNYISFNEIYNNKITTFGGGLFSYYPIKLLIYLLSYYGSLLVIISAIITVIFLYFNINHRTFVLKLKYYIVNAFDKNEYVEDTTEYYEDDIIYDEYPTSDIEQENSNEKRYNNIKDKDLVVDIREFKEDEVNNDDEYIQKSTRKQKKSRVNNSEVEEVTNDLKTSTCHIVK